MASECLFMFHYALCLVAQNDGLTMPPADGGVIVRSYSLHANQKKGKNERPHIIGRDR